MKRKLLAAFLATTMTLGLLAGCGAKEEAPASSEVSKSESPAASEAPAEEEYIPTYPYETDVTLKIYVDAFVAQCKTMGLDTEKGIIQEAYDEFIK